MRIKIVDVEKTISVNNERIRLYYDFFLHVDNKMINTTIATELIDSDLITHESPSPKDEGFSTSSSVVLI